MKYAKKVTILSVFILVFSLAFAVGVKAETLSQNLSGRILLQVEENGEAWYVYPGNNLRYFLGRPAAAFSIMEDLGLGISEENYSSFENDVPENMLGMILLRVESNGEAYYVDPAQEELVYLGKPSDAFQIMKERGLGIENDNLEMMPVAVTTMLPDNDMLDIFISNPSWGDVVSSPVTIQGKAKVFESQVNIRVRDSEDNILVDTTAMTNASDVGEYGAFEKIIGFTEPDTESGYVEVFNTSFRDGNEINKVVSWIRF